MFESINESEDFDWVNDIKPKDGPLDGIRFRVPRSLAKRTIHLIVDDGVGSSVKTVWMAGDSLMSNHIEREMAEKYLKNGWWKRV